jgi:2-hydroxychromene-2-carboxylate isomerase
MTRIDFWYDFASTYSYPAAMRVEDLARGHPVELRWRPFLLGPIFASHGWRNSPFNLYPAKGRYMWRDIERICTAVGLPFQRPDPFPQNSLLAARVTLALAEQDRPAFSRAVYTAEFAQGKPIAERSVIAELLAGLGHDPSVTIERALSEPIKTKVRTETDEAQRLGIFGAPTCVIEGGEMFWGNDRLEEALAGALEHG